MNGRFMAAIAGAGDVDVFVTPDQGIPHQQNVAALPFAVLVLRTGRGLALDALLALMPEVRRLLPTLRPGTVTWVEPPPEQHPA